MRLRLTLPLVAVCLGAFLLAQSAVSAPGGTRDFGSSPEALLRVSAAAPLGSPLPPRREARPVRPRGHLIARIRRTVGLRTRPGGPVEARLSRRSEFGSPRVLGVAAVRGRWLGVLTPARPNGRLGWIDRRSPGLRLSRTRMSLHADLSSRTLELRRGRRVRLRLPVAVGRPGSPTPSGRFAVTDKLPGGRFGGYYGCCILALSGFQPNTPPGWRGGNRLAIHGTSSPGTIGQAASAGCLRAGDAPLRVLMARVPLGTPVFIRR